MKKKYKNLMYNRKTKKGRRAFEKFENSPEFTRNRDPKS